jgi:hypothetical protein
MYNMTKLSLGFFESVNRPLAIDHKMTRLKGLVDNAYLNYYADLKGLPNIDLHIKTQAFPTPSSRFIEGSNVIGVLGQFYLFFPPMVIFSMLLIDIVKEKEKNLKNYLNLSGLSLTGYWLGWLSVGLINSFIVASEIVLLGRYFFVYEIFTNGNILVPFSLFFTFTYAIQIFAMFISSLVKTANVATAVNIY